MTKIIIRKNNPKVMKKYVNEHEFFAIIIDKDEILNYSPVGGHSSCNYNWCIANSTPASEEETSYFISEHLVKNAGYSLKEIKICKRK